MGKRTLAGLGLLCVALAGCGGSNPTPPAPYAGWSITEYGVNGVQRADAQPIPSASFAIPGGSASTNWISYIEHPAVTIAGNLELSWTVTGSSPEFVNDTPNNTCGGPAAVSLIFRNPGRFFSLSSLQVPLALGSFSLSVPLTADKWINQDGGGFSPAVINSFGFVLGGGCFAGHGVAVASGSATITIQGEGAN